MTALADPATLLATWERAVAAPVAARGAVLVHGAGLVSRLDEALDLDLGTCAGLAARAYREDFGATAEVVASCRTCGELLEAVIPVAGLGTEQAGRATVTVGAWVVRALTTRDLVDAAAEPDPARELTRRAVCHARTGVPPRAVSAAVEAAAEELAGQGALVSVVRCPGCADELEIGLDVADLLWERVAAVGSALLADVAMLASAFGWSESEILALPAARRHAYLGLAAP